MPTYIAFLRAINLGARRKFPKDAIAAATASIGACDVETYINTGNVRLTSLMRSTAKVEEALEAAYLADRGFEVPTIALTPDELRRVAEEAEAVRAQLGEPRTHYVTLLKAAPSEAALAAVQALEAPGERLVVRGRGAHLLLDEGMQGSRLSNAKELKALGVGTARNVTVVRTLAERWC
ncbi:DUF1697 domain-containing protein [Nocardioides daphniae]|uniref:DUF1697 domain-containing protein n=1 Tax=Nocardioides daphniae TaxID=402297 RepID=A0A4P7U9X5_9ACTN|nr:DUF1697 domain-containing protein [Nocardioides daphniae]QCC76746.1 DUF1697 domain-containing protein [Nocardioides daphniae]GGD15967.1 hypothetical protein GCM10007231_13700 [Nocardioides daphniae]